MSKKYRILSIDGGGIRGIIPASIVLYLEKRLQEISGKPSVRISDYIDYMTGTSTGGILVCAYLSPSANSQQTYKFTAEDALRLYLERGAFIFSSGMWDKFRSLGGILKERYSSQPLEKYLSVFFREIKLNELLKPCLITSYDIEKKCAVYFQSVLAAADKANNFYVRDVCRATASAPTFFEPARINSFSDQAYTLVDGAVLANNPALCALTEAAVYFSSTGIPLSPDRFELISLGTGKNQKAYTYEQVKDWGGLGWLNPILDIMINGVSETTERELSVLFHAAQAPDQYHRIQPELIDVNTDMDDASPENIERLKQVSIQCIERNKDKLEVILERLVKNS